MKKTIKILKGEINRCITNETDLVVLHRKDAEQILAELTLNNDVKLMRTNLLQVRQMVSQIRNVVNKD